MPRQINGGTGEHTGLSDTPAVRLLSARTSFSPLRRHPVSLCSRPPHDVTPTRRYWRPELPHPAVRENEHVSRESATGQLLPTETQWRAAQAKGLGSPPVAVVRPLISATSRRTAIFAIGQAGAISLRPHQSRAPVLGEREPPLSRNAIARRVLLAEAPARNHPDRGTGLVNLGILAQQPAEGCTTPATPLRWNFAACF
jgi:hypothetical protein